jgi:hypothetical protein
MLQILVLSTGLHCTACTALRQRLHSCQHRRLCRRCLLQCSRPCRGKCLLCTVHWRRCTLQWHTRHNRHPEGVRIWWPIHASRAGKINHLHATSLSQMLRSLYQNAYAKLQEHLLTIALRCITGSGCSCSCACAACYRLCSSIVHRVSTNTVRACRALCYVLDPGPSIARAIQY